MTERRDLKSSLPGAGLPDEAACGEWEALLADALDGRLRVEDEANFSSHMSECPACAAMFAEAGRGREWLSFLSAEPEVPHDLLEKILARTGPGRIPGIGPNQIAAAGIAGTAPAATPWRQPALPSPGFIAFAQRAAATRLMMTAAMAFFSVALTLNLAGVRLTHLSLSAMRPAVVRATLERRLATATVPVERYYDHLRVVHEVESSVRVLRNNINGDYQNDNQDNKQRQSQPEGPGVSGAAGQRKNRQDDAAKEPGSTTPAPADDFTRSAQTRSGIWTA